MIKAIALPLFYLDTITEEIVDPASLVRLVEKLKSKV